MRNVCKEKAVFVSRKGALSAALKVCRGNGMPDDVIVKSAKTRKVIARGELKGYEAWYAHGMVQRPVYEEECV